MGNLLLGNLVFAVIVVLIYMTMWYLVALSEKRNDIADVAWGLGFVVLTAALAYRTEEINTKTWLVITMIFIWGIRLATHIALRRKGKPEDKRYVAMRESWKYKTLQSYLNVFISQGFFMIVVSAPIILLLSSDAKGLEWYNYLGLLIWLIGFLFESISDFQLAQFIKDKSNKGKIMRSGLWRYTRHPNYFGEISLWWGIYLTTLFTNYWYIGIIGPATITFLIIGVSGIPMLEKRYKGNKQYEDYQKTTNAFFPMPNKK